MLDTLIFLKIDDFQHNFSAADDEDEDEEDDDFHTDMNTDFSPSALLTDIVARQRL